MLSALRRGGRRCTALRSVERHRGLVRDRERPEETVVEGKGTLKRHYRGRIGRTTGTGGAGEANLGDGLAAKTAYARAFAQAPSVGVATPGQFVELSAGPVAGL